MTIRTLYGEFVITKNSKACCQKCSCYIICQADSLSHAISSEQDRQTDREKDRHLFAKKHNMKE